MTEPRTVTITYNELDLDVYGTFTKGAEATLDQPPTPDIFEIDEISTTLKGCHSCWGGGTDNLTDFFNNMYTKNDNGSITPVIDDIVLLCIEAVNE